MTSRDPDPADAPHGEPAAGRLPAASASFEQSAERFARLPADALPAGPAEPETAPDPAPGPAAAAGTGPAPSTRRGAWRAWRGRRPFLGGVLMTLGGLEVLATEKASLGVVVHVGMEGLSGYLIPTMLVVCGVLTLVNPAQRMFYSVLGVLLALGSWVTSNLGGFFVGLLLGVAGSCLAFGWLPDQEPRARGRGRSRRPGPAPSAGSADPVAGEGAPS